MINYLIYIWNQSLIFFLTVFYNIYNCIFEQIHILQTEVDEVIKVVCVLLCLKNVILCILHTTFIKI